MACLKPCVVLYPLCGVPSREGSPLRCTCSVTWALTALTAASGQAVHQGSGEKHARACLTHLHAHEHLLLCKQQQCSKGSPFLCTLLSYHGGLTHQQ